MQQASDKQMFENLLQNIYTYYTLLLHVPAIKFGHFQSASASARKRTKITWSSRVSSRHYPDWACLFLIDIIMKG